MISVYINKLCFKAPLLGKAAWRKQIIFLNSVILMICIVRNKITEDSKYKAKEKRAASYPICARQQVRCSVYLQNARNDTANCQGCNPGMSQQPVI